MNQWKQVLGALVLSGLCAIAATWAHAVSSAAESTGPAPKKLRGPGRSPLNVEPAPIAGDKSVKYDYDIVYVRAPRFVKQSNQTTRPSWWPEVGHPTAIDPGYDLMLLHPDGTEEVLVEAGKGSVTDPYVSFDGEWVYYSYFHAANATPWSAGPWTGGADIYKIHVKSRKVVRLTHQEMTPNTGVADWSSDFRTPQKGKTHLRYTGAYNLGPCPLPGGKLAFVSNRDAFKTPRGYPLQALQLFVMDDDGGNVEKIGHLNVAGALHPVVLKDGRILFSSLESQGNRYEIAWGIWSIHPDGTNWEPVISAFAGGGGTMHFQTQLSDGGIVIEEYYSQNTAGFGSFLKMPPAPPAGVSAFGPAFLTPNPKLSMLDLPPHALPFEPYGIEVLTRFCDGNDDPAHLSIPGDPKSLRVGKVTHPCGAPDNHLLTVWTPGAAPSKGGWCGGPQTDSGIYLLKGGKPIDEPGQMLLIKNDPNYNEQWPRPLVPYARVYGVREPARLAPLANHGKLSPHLPEGTPFGLVGTSSNYKRESAHRGKVPAGSVTAKGVWHDSFRVTEGLDNQGSDAGLYDNSEIHAVRILAMEPATMPVASRFYNHARERLRILGEIPLRKFGEPGALATGGQSLDPDGNPDTSFLAKIPADVAYTFQLLDKDGMALTTAMTWHQARPGEVRNNCGGCHAHSQPPTEFKDTYAARRDYPVFDLTTQTPLLTTKAKDQSGKQWDVKNETGLRYDKGVKNVEFYRDIQPILQRSCVACHTHQWEKPAGGLVLDHPEAAPKPGSGELGAAPAAYKQLAGFYKPHVPTSQQRYLTVRFQARRSLLAWKVLGRRTDGLPDRAPPGGEEHYKQLRAIDFTGSAMPPPEAVAGTYAGPEGRKIKVEPLSDEDRRTIVRWIDLGCPIDFDFDPKQPQARGHGWLLDDQRPTLTLTHPQPGANEPLTRLLVGMADYDMGLDLTSFQVVADFPLDGVKPGENLASRFKGKGDGVWELLLATPIATLPKGKLTVSVKDRQGNVTRIERIFAVAPAPR